MATTDLEGRLGSQEKIIGCPHGSYAPGKILRSLPDSQGGSGRHKCVVCAYQLGRANEVGVAAPQAWEPRPAEYKGAIARVELPEPRRLPPLDPRWWERDQDRLKAIGDLGEELVVEYEKSVLISGGRCDLANIVAHVSRTEGDAAGYDVRSYDMDGSVKFIEVKTTTGTSSTPFFISENERVFAAANSDRYYIYRLFGLDEVNERASFFVAAGYPSEHFVVTPTDYQVALRGAAPANIIEVRAK